ncbi:MAG TPA: hypothetical protein VFI31_03055 [Pirellulales bacterium]|nr:hypothetical protein [Pirellulales bacterium]
MEYDLVRLFEHPLRFRDCIPSAIVLFGGGARGRFPLKIQWRNHAEEVSQTSTLLVTWDVEALREHFADIDEEIDILRTRDDDRAAMVELAAVVVAVSVMAHIEPRSRFTRRSAIGTAHDYYLNETSTEMIEVAGRWQGGLSHLFAQKKRQSECNPRLLKRWVSVTVIMKKARNRTEGLHI